MLTRLASPQLLRIDKSLTEAADVGEVESDLRRGDVLGQGVNFVLEAIPLEGLLDLAVKTGDNPINLGTDMGVDRSRRETGEIVEQDIDALAPSSKCSETFGKTGELLESALELKSSLREAVGVSRGKLV